MTKNEMLDYINCQYELQESSLLVSVMGLYDKGKTFFINHLVDHSLPSGKKSTTKGLSFKTIYLNDCTKFTIVDTAGTYSPVCFVNKSDLKSKIKEKCSTENFLNDLAFSISDYYF